MYDVKFVHMIERSISRELERLLERTPAVVLTGPRQVGKTTLAREITRKRKAVYLDLENPRDLAKIEDIQQFCELNEGKLIVFDEVQRAPGIFSTLRVIIDGYRQRGLRTGHFLLLGSASIDLLRQSGESLAGRVSYLELGPFSAREVDEGETLKLWNRGGFPESFLARNDNESTRWREDFIRTYLERDIPQLGPRIPAETLRRFWTMLAHKQGGLFNASELARGLDVTGVTAGRYLDLLVDLLLVRRHKPWTSNQGKRLVKTPKIYVRDSGVTHALLGIPTINGLLGHPAAGGSWEGYVIENIAGVMPKLASMGFYRTKGGAEIDLVVDSGKGGLWAIEIKRSSVPKLSKGFHVACEDLKPTRRFVVHGGRESFPIGKGVKAVSLRDMMKRVSKL